MDDLHGGAKTCVTTGNASLSLCNIDEKGDTPVNTAPLSAEAQKRADKDAEEKSKPDYSSFDIVKAAQYGALERVVELVDEKGKPTMHIFLYFSASWIYILSVRIALWDSILILEIFKVMMLTKEMMKTSHYCTGRPLIIGKRLQNS